MPIVDILIAVAIVISVVVGIMRGFIKEAISIATLLVAIWTAMNFGANVGTLGDDWLGSEGLQLWFGRLLVFVVVLALGGILGWGFSRLMRLSVLNGTDRALGGLFGFCRGAVLLGVFIIGGQLASFDNDAWWRESRLIPYGTFVADWIRVMAPKGVDLLIPANGERQAQDS
ncbi:MAG TPA: CvpA family protein [Woeseiaceae bacterium]|nr:CvpA family protein [Woeseiaceae bacterium]